MTRYIAGIVSTDGFDYWSNREGTANTLHEEERQPKDTGLIDKRGMTIYRVEDKGPFGFHSFNTSAAQTVRDEG